MQGKSFKIVLLFNSVGPRFQRQMNHVERRILSAFTIQGKTSILFLLFPGIWALLHPLMNLVPVYGWFLNSLKNCFATVADWVAVLLAVCP
jgi:hypothetical protein